MRILVTRPTQDGQAIAARLAAMGHQALLAPLLTPVFEDGPAPDFTGIQAILATSANGVRALARRTGRRDIPIFSVGPQTAEEARQEGFAPVRNADGDAVALARAVTGWADPGKGALLHVCGADAPGALADALAAAGFTVRRAVLYRIEAAAALPPDAVAALRDGAVDGALFFSPRSAQVFCDLAAGLPLQAVAAFCISPATAAALAGAAFARVAVAARPNQDALLSLLA